MDEFEHIRKAAPEIYLKNTFHFLKNLFAKKKVKIISPFPPINGLDCEIEKTDRVFKFSTNGINHSNLIKYQDQGYGYQDAFDLIDSERTYNIKNGAGSTNIKPGQDFKTDGTLWEIESGYNLDTSYFRALYPLKEFHKLPVHYIESSCFREGDSFRGAGLIKLTIQNTPILFYDCDVEKKRYLIIESTERLNYQQFEKITEAIIFCFAIASGYLARHEVYLLKSDTKNFAEVNGFQIKKIGDSIIGIQAISPRDHKDFDSSISKKQYLSASIFSNLIQQCLEDARLLRTIKIITESFEYPFEIQAATYSVALETIKNIVIEKNEEKTNPFKTKAIAAKTILELKTVLNNVDNAEFNSKETVLKKIEQLNQIGNTDSFQALFDLLEITLNEDDKRCISKRNDFLHGRIPFENEGNELKSKELKHIVYKLHFLLCATILKNAGFNGYIMNNLKFADHFQLKKGINEDFFRKI